jgi:hypothetical protein
MRRALVGLTLVVLACAAPLASTRQDRDQAGGVVVTVRGCVSGSLLKSVVGEAAPGGTQVSSDRYRMVGSKAVKAQIKKANKALVQVTGRIRPVPHSVVKGTKMGGTSIGIGVAPGSGSMEQQAPYTPTIEVEEILVIAKTC